MSKWKKNLLGLCALLFAVAGLGIAYVLGTRGEDEPPIEPPPPPTVIVLSHRPQAEVARIYVTQGADTHLFLPGDALAPGLYQWYLAAHPDWQLDFMRVQELLRPVFQLTTTEVLHECTADVPLADFGLDPPAVTLTAYDHHGAQTRFYLGSPTPDRSRFYFMTAGDPALYLIPLMDGFWLQQNVYELIARHVPALPLDALAYLHVKQYGREAIILQDELLIYPPALAGQRLDPFVLHYLLLESFSENFRLGEVVALAPDDLTPFGLTEPFLDLAVETGGAALHVRFGYHRGAYIYVMMAGRPHVFRTPFAPVSAWVDFNVMLYLVRFIALVPVVEVDRVLIQQGEYVLTLVPANATLNGRAIDEAAFTQLYRLLITISADSLLPPHPPAGTPELTVFYQLLDGGGIRIDFFAYDANFFTFSVNGSEVWATTNRRGVEMFLEEAARLIPY